MNSRQDMVVVFTPGEKGRLPFIGELKSGVLISYQENHTNKNSQQVGCAVSQSTVCSRWKLSSLLIQQQNPFEARRADDLVPPSVYRIQDQ